MKFWNLEMLLQALCAILDKNFHEPMEVPKMIFHLTDIASGHKRVMGHEDKVNE